MSLGEYLPTFRNIMLPSFPRSGSSTVTKRFREFPVFSLLMKELVRHPVISTDLRYKIG
jgi:hypothetical protein